jgi:hypothetical protein
MCDITDRLRQLIALGYRFAHPRNAGGHVVAVTGVRTHHNVVDVFQLYGETAANAARMSCDEADILSPRSVMWCAGGDPTDVIDQLLDLPDPERSEDDRRGCWVATAPGREHWLPASA